MVRGEAGVTRRTWRWIVGVVAGVVVAVVVIVLLTRLVPPQDVVGGSGDYPYYATTADLEGTADLIVRGTFSSITADDSEGFPQEVATVEVTAAAKGSVEPGSTLEIRYTTGSEDPPGGLAVGGEYVILLDDLADVAGDVPPTPVNADQGFYTVVDGHAVASPTNKVLLAPATLQALGLS